MPSCVLVTSSSVWGESEGETQVNRVTIQLPQDVYLCDYPECSTILINDSELPSCSQCSSTYCGDHGTTIFDHSTSSDTSGGEEEEEDDDDDKQDRKHSKTEAPIGCIACTHNVQYINRRQFTDHDVMSFLLCKYKLSVTDAIGLMRDELQERVVVNTKSKKKKKKTKTRIHDQESFVIFASLRLSDQQEGDE
jgi:hypothetical protein